MRAHGAQTINSLAGFDTSFEVGHSEVLALFFEVKQA